MPNYLVRFVQMHESFRTAELKALAKIAGVDLEVLKYDEDVGEKISVSAQIVQPSVMRAKSPLTMYLFSFGSNSELDLFLVS
jgi:tRNA G10  N-methylase Trm11